MKLKSDAQGFLVGIPLSDDDAVKILSRIKGDTGHILDVIGRRQSASRFTATPAGRGAPAIGAVAVPAAGRANTGSRGAGLVAAPVARGYRARDAATGRFSPGTSTADLRVRTVATAAEKIARTIQAERRDARAEAVAGQTRDARGRFGAGTGGAAGGGFRARLAALGGRAGGVADGARQIDPLLAAVSEARGVATPIGRAGSMLFGGGGGASGEPMGWLRRMWRELRTLRIGGAKADRDMLRELKDQKGGGRGTAEGGGLLSTLMSLIPALSAAVPGVAGLGAVAGKLAALLTRVAPSLPVAGLLKRLPVVGALFELGAGAVEDQRIAGDTTLTDAERRRQRAANAGGVGGALGGATAGAVAGSVFGPVGTVAGAVVGGFAGSELGKRAGGWVSERFESGKGGAGTVSSGVGDHGGKSYGTHQLSSNTGTLQRFLATSGYGGEFQGLRPGSKEFDARWKAVAARDSEFGTAQRQFMERTHVAPMMQRLATAGIDLSGRGEAVKEAIFSTATQFGPGSSVVQKALAGRNVAQLSDADIVTAIQDHKIANNSSLFRSSSAAVQASTLNRAAAEKQVLLSVAGQGTQTPRMPSLPTMPAMPMVMTAPPMPAIDVPLPARAAGAPTSSAPPAPPAGQDVRDRTIAHIVTGGIGGSLAHR
jgi:hypothetical protein